ncbi:hypothetical protein F7725_013775 [Dissostichus mawsoni]|uniref:Uncharacterized protein n=1 Tax=Dissostichus mawsoni TaxID=36200 RepID=A0A7J5YX56_DISMA|nr:hypothetical protein F7725_013775 [Dissostichus mawsoni]
MNEQHAKVYEQLDGTARELERTNVSLVIDSKNSHQKIERSVQVETLSGQVEQLRSMEQLRVRREKRERRKTIHSFPCLRELCTAPGYEDQFVVGRAESFTVDAKRPPFEEENQHLREADAESCQARVRELEVELQELQQLRRARTFLMSSEDDGTTITQTVLNSTPETDTFLEVEVSEETGGGVREANEGGGKSVGGESLPESSPVRKSCSDTALNAIVARDADPSMKDCAIGPTPVPPPTPTQSPSTPEAMESISKQVDAVDKRLDKTRRKIFSRIQKTKMDIKATKVAKASKSGKSGKSSKQ